MKENSWKNKSMIHRIVILELIFICVQISRHNVDCIVFLLLGCKNKIFDYNIFFVKSK